MEQLERPPVAEAEIRRRIQELIELKGGGANPDLVSDIIENALKMLADVTDRGDARVMAMAIRELRLAYKLFAPYAEKRKVTMFGSARTLPTKAEYQQATRVRAQDGGGGLDGHHGRRAGNHAGRSRGRGPGEQLSARTFVCRGNKRPTPSSRRTRSSSRSDISSRAS